MLKVMDPQVFSQKKDTKMSRKDSDEEEKYEMHESWMKSAVRYVVKTASKEGNTDQTTHSEQEQPFYENSHENSTHSNPLRNSVD